MSFRRPFRLSLQGKSPCSVPSPGGTVAEVDFRILGPLEVWDGDRQLELGGPKRRAVLALLLLHANEVIAVDRLADQLWGERAPRNATAAIHTHVSRLRKELGPEIIARRSSGYVLCAEPGALDLERFERLITGAEDLPARERAEIMREALALWRGPPLQDLTFEPALAKYVARLDELHLSALENRVDADLEAGALAGLVGELESLIAEHPLRERLRGQLILALYRSGRQAEALEVCRETRRVLAEELGLDPSPELRDLERAILQQDPALTSPRGAEAVAEQSVRPRGGRRILIGTSLAVLLGGLGAAAAYALTAHTTQAAQQQTTSVPIDTTKTTTVGQTEARKSTTTSGHGQPHHGATTTTKTSRDSSTVSTASTRTEPTNHGDGSSHRPPKPVTLSDDFGDYLHSTFWSQVRVGGDVSLFEQAGQLQLTVGASAVPAGPYNRIDVHVETKCSFPGDFDARVHYSLPPGEWPAEDNIDVGMYATYGVAAVMRDSSSQSGDGYISWVGPGSSSDPATAPFPDSSGRLRIARVNGIETTYFWHQDHWKELASSRQAGRVVIGLQGVSDGQNPFGGIELKAAFQDFRVTGVKPVCPPGARKSG